MSFTKEAGKPQEETEGLVICFQRLFQVPIRLCIMQADRAYCSNGGDIKCMKFP
jgi:hypothetical protein